MAEESRINRLIAKNQKRYFAILDQTQGSVELFTACRDISFGEFDDKTAEIRFIRDYFYNEGIESAIIYQIFTLKLRNIYQKEQKAKEMHSLFRQTTQTTPVILCKLLKLARQFIAKLLYYW